MKRAREKVFRDVHGVLIDRVFLRSILSRLSRRTRSRDVFIDRAIARGVVGGTRIYRSVSCCSEFSIDWRCARAFIARNEADVRRHIARIASIGSIHGESGTTPRRRPSLHDLSSLLFSSLPLSLFAFTAAAAFAFSSSSSSSSSRRCGFSRSTGRPVDWLLKGACLLAYNNERTRNYLSTRRKRIRSSCGSCVARPATPRHSIANDRA